MVAFPITSVRKSYYYENTSTIFFVDGNIYNHFLWLRSEIRWQKKWLFLCVHCLPIGSEHEVPLSSPLALKYYRMSLAGLCALGLKDG